MTLFFSLFSINQQIRLHLVNQTYRNPIRISRRKDCFSLSFSLKDKALDYTGQEPLKHFSSPCTVMAVWVVEFSNGGIIRKIFAKNQNTNRKFLNFENWTNGEPQQLAKVYKVITCVYGDSKYRRMALIGCDT